MCSAVNNFAVVLLLLYSSLSRFLESSTKGITRTSNGMLSFISLFLSDYCLVFLMFEHMSHMVCTTCQRDPHRPLMCFRLVFYKSEKWSFTELINCIVLYKIKFLLRDLGLVHHSLILQKQAKQGFWGVKHPKSVITLLESWLYF